MQSYRLKSRILWPLCLGFVLLLEIFTSCAFILYCDFNYADFFQRKKKLPIFGGNNNKSYEKQKKSPFYIASEKCAKDEHFPPSPILLKLMRRKKLPNKPVYVQECTKIVRDRKDPTIIEFYYQRKMIHLQNLAKSTKLVCFT